MSERHRPSQRPAAATTTGGRGKASPARRVAPVKKARAVAPAPSAAKPASPASPAKPAKPGKQAKQTEAGKQAKAARPALVRDSFTMPHEDFRLIAALKDRALSAKRPAKKSELLRAGLRVLEGLSAAALVAVLNKLMPLKPGRPRKPR